MKFLRALFLSLVVIAPAFAADYVAGPSNGAQLHGTTTNDNAAAGNVGEYQANACPNATTATVTITIATPGVISWAANGLTGLCPVSFTTSGALPTGLTAATTYYVLPGATLQAGSFEVATTIANAIAGTAITTTGTQSGTQTGTAVATMVNATAQPTTALNLTAGDWDVSCVVEYVAASSTVALLYVAGISTSPSVQTPALGADFAQGYSTGVTGAVGATYVSPTVRESLGSTTTIYCLGEASFTTAAMTAATTMRARRVR